MPVATLRFKLPEEQAEHRDAVQGGDTKSVLWDLDQTMRGWLKYGFPPHLISDGSDGGVPDADKAVKELRDNLHNLCYSAGINLDD